MITPNLTVTIENSNLARRSILNNVHERLKKTAPAATQYPPENVPKSPVPDEHGSKVQHFINKATELSTTVAWVGNIEEAVIELMRYGQEVIPTAKRWVVAPELKELLWPLLGGVNLAMRSAEPDDEVGITGAFCAIADTGTLMLLSGKSTPSNLSLLPETHIVFLPVNRVLSYMEDAFALWQKENAKTAKDQDFMPRAINFISGPSRTADIEQTIVLGAHGPFRVHIILY